MSFNARNLIPWEPPVPEPEHPHNGRLGDILLENGAVQPGDLLKALVLQRNKDLRLGEILVGLGLTAETAVLDALGKQLSLPVVDLLRDPPDRVLGSLYPVSECILHGFAIWRQAGDSLIVAISDPAQMDGVRDLLQGVTRKIHFVLAQRRAILRYYQTGFKSDLSNAANTRCPEQDSIRSWSGHKPKLVGLGLLAGMLAFLALAPEVFLLGILGWILLAILGNSLFKLVALITYLTNPPAVTPPKPEGKQPRISIMVPLLHEVDILDRLIQRMSALDYPKDLLEICLVYEENDAQTKSCLQKRHLPYWMRKIEVPENSLQTKPRALNYALDFCSGEIIGIYDAEDAPEPDQLHRVVQKFMDSDEKLACVQCQLDFYNSRTNWLSRCFTIEYAVLFRVVLPGLERLRLPIPLGGTSVFFRRAALEKLGRWDAHNVTEDADLGMRLSRQGYRCACVPATTYEEANFRTLPWIRQRSRWLKGFLQTWITHMRRPVRLYRDLGPASFAFFQILFLGTFTSFAAAPLLLPLWAFSFGIVIPFYHPVPTQMIQTMTVIFLLTEALLLILGFVAIRARKSVDLAGFLPLMLVYWPLGSFAAYKALYELFARPMYWDKTPHGINDREHQNEIDRLTVGKYRDTKARYGKALTDRFHRLKV